MRAERITPPGRARWVPAAAVVRAAAGVAAAAVAGWALVGCTTLGPMPGATGVAAVPAGRPDVAISGAAVPGYYLSSATQSSPSGSGLLQFSLLLEPDWLIRLPGVVAGVRHVGDSTDGGYYEPLLGYRCHLDDAQRFSAVGVGYFTRASGSHNGTSYSATRGGGEIGFDVRATPRSRWIEIHANVSAALTGLSATGHYCLDGTGQYGTDCSAGPTTDVSGGGLYPSGTAGVSLDFARHLGIFFHGGRFVLGVSGGTMPTVIAGKQGDARWYGSAGASLSLSFGSNR